jgi:hypothetical protein
VIIGEYERQMLIALESNRVTENDRAALASTVVQELVQVVARWPRPRAASAHIIMQRQATAHLPHRLQLSWLWCAAERLTPYVRPTTAPA